MAKVDVVYRGPQPARDVKLGDRRVRVERGKTIKVSEQVAESLCASPYFTRAPEQKQERKTPRTSKPKGSDGLRLSESVPSGSTSFKQKED